MEDNNRYSLSYRAAEMRQVMAWITAGQSGHIIGLRGAGKSNFIRFLMHTETQQHYLGQNQANFIFILVNLLALSERTEWAIYEMLINQLLAELHSVNIAVEAINEITGLQQDVIRTQNAQAAQRIVERCVALLCQQPTRQLIFLFDEFDAAFRELPASAFRGLRAIRDAYKEQISYIVVSKRDLADLRSDLTENVDHFYRLVSRNVCGLGPYNEADTRQMIRYLSMRRALALSETDAGRLFALSGGHAGLLKTILNLLADAEGIAKLAPTLDKEPAIERECQKLWENFSDAEKADLCAVSTGHPLDAVAINRLKVRGLIRQNGADAPVFFSPLFAVFVRNQATSSPQGTFVSRNPPIVQINSQRVDLAPQEFELLCYLYEQRGQVCSRERLIEQVYPDAAYSMDNQRLEKLISRLRGKIEPDPAQPRYILTLRGGGYKFVLPEEP